MIGGGDKGQRSLRNLTSFYLSTKVNVMEGTTMQRRSPSVFLLILSVVLLISFCSTSMLLAQARGVISGRVVDASDGSFLPGANISVRGTTYGAASDREGVFLILNVPYGTYELEINYIGYRDFTQEVTLSADNARIMLGEIQMQVSALETEAIVVEGQLEGQMKALNQQRVAPNIKNVVSREQMELFPDYTTADVLQRVPGVYISRDQGEGRYVLVRGTEPRLSNVKVNGEELATNRVQERYSQLDIIGSNQVASIEVVKALTPDLDGDAIGGTVNLVTRSAFDYPGMRLRATAGAGYANLRGTPIYQGKFSFSNRLGPTGNMGYSLTANWDRTDKGAHNSEKTWGQLRTETGETVPWGLLEMDLRDYYNIRDRIGFGGTFEYRPTSDSRFYVEGMWNKLNDDQERARKRFRFDSGDFETYVPGDEALITGGRIVTQSEVRVEELIQTQFSVGGENQIDNLSVDYKYAYSYASEHHPDQIESEFDLRGIDFTIGLTDQLFPTIDTTNTGDNVDIYDDALYRFRSIDYRTTSAGNINHVGSVNFKLPVTLGGLASELKFGGKYREKMKDRSDTRRGYEWDGTRFYLDSLVSDRETTDFLDGHYRYGPQPDRDKVEKFYWDNEPDSVNFPRETDIWDSRGQTYWAKEKIYAAYAMLTVNWNELMILAGARYEGTSNKYQGTDLVYDDDGNIITLNDTTGERSKDDFMPMIHLKYQFGRMTNGRVAFTRTIARPNYFDLVPYREEDPGGDGSLRLGNPELKTTTSNNLDLMAEHYFTGVGVLSGGFFYKWMDNIIFELRSYIANDPTGRYTGWQFRGPVNGGKAELYGFELNWQQQLNFLPGMLSGFGIYANYTKIWATSDLTPQTVWSSSTNPDSTNIRADVDALPGQASDVANLALSYEWGPFSGRVSLMYQAKYMVEVGGNPSGAADIWRDSHLQLDVSASYKIIPQLDLFAEFINLTNEPKVEYIGISDQPTQQEYYSWWMRGGLRFSL